MRKPVTLLKDAVSTDTVEALQTLLGHAESGEVIGIAFVAQLKERAFIVNTAGECHRNPTWTRGMVAALDDSLSNRVHNRAETQ
jgi:hypothetical protein